MTHKTTLKTYSLAPLSALFFLCHLHFGLRLQHLLSIPSPLVKFQKQWLRHDEVSTRNAGPCAVNGCDAQEA